MICLVLLGIYGWNVDIGICTCLMYNIYATYMTLIGLTTIFSF